MNETYRNRLAQLDEINAKLYDKLKEINSELLSRKPRADSWSVLQVINHLIIAEAGTLNYLHKKIKSPTLPGRSSLEPVKMVFLYLIMISPLKFKAPKVVSEPENRDLESSFEEWGKIRKSIREFVEEYPESNLNKAIFKHPFIGRISLESTLWFFKMHIEHHQKQIDRLLKD
jgi:hypothetical protein